MRGDAGLLCQLLYGCGLRVTDVHVEAGNLEIRGGKGDKDRTMTLPKALLGHKNVATTEIYTQLAKAMRGEITSPLDDL